MRLYEGMFLFDTTAAHEWSAVEAEVRRLMERIGAEPLVCIKYDERRLAYEINKRKRGVYVLTYFNSEPEKIGQLERDTHLSEMVLRLLVLKAEEVTPERIKELQALPADQPLSPSGPERDERDRGPRGDRDDRGGYRDRDDRGGYRDRDDRGGYRGDRGDRDDRGGYRGDRGDRDDRGGYRGDRDDRGGRGDRGGFRGDRDDRGDGPRRGREEGGEAPVGADQGDQD